MLTIFYNHGWIQLQGHKWDYCTFFFSWWHNEVKIHKCWRTVKLLHIYNRNCFFQLPGCVVSSFHLSSEGLWTCKTTAWFIWCDCFWSSRNKENFSWQCIWMPCSSINWRFHGDTTWFFCHVTGLPISGCKSQKQSGGMWLVRGAFPPVFWATVFQM